MIGATSYVALVLLAAYFQFIVGSRLVYHNDASLPDQIDMMEIFIGEPPRNVMGVVKRNEDGNSPVKEVPSLWFGPRLGRRKRSVEAESERKKRDVEDNGLLGKDVALMKLAPNGPWALVSLGGGKRRSVNFTPRLGRESDEEALENYVDAYGAYARSPTRSGGNVRTGNVDSNFTPRLGRLAPPETH